MCEARRGKRFSSKKLIDLLELIARQSLRNAFIERPYQSLSYSTYFIRYAALTLSWQPNAYKVPTADAFIWALLRCCENLLMHRTIIYTSVDQIDDVVNGARCAYYIGVYNIRIRLANLTFQLFTRQPLIKHSCRTRRCRVTMVV